MRYLSHYTSLAGLEGIASFGTLRASNFLGLNDTSEFLYAFSKLVKAASREIYDLLPDEHRVAGVDIEKAFEPLAKELRQLYRSQEGYEQLFVTSFATARNDDEENRGMLTLWDRYTKNEGYCLQFDPAEIARLVELETSRASYATASIEPVEYGITETTRAFQDLRFQMKQQLIEFINKVRPEVPIECDYNKKWVASNFARELFLYCARHKDPSFVDEREKRILLFPGARTEARFMVGVAFRKKIYLLPDGRKYIVVGENWKPGISPARVIVGPKADANISSIVARFHRKPDVLKSDIPIV